MSIITRHVVSTVGCCSLVFPMWCLLNLFTTAKAPVASDIDGRLLPTETCTTHAAANNYSWLMEHGPVDWVMRSRGVVETWDFGGREG